jgi:hypothetical protein
MANRLVHFMYLGMYFGFGPLPQPPKLLEESG